MHVAVNPAGFYLPSVRVELCDTYRIVCRIASRIDAMDTRRLSVSVLFRGNIYMCIAANPKMLIWPDPEKDMHRRVQPITVLYASYQTA